MGFGQDSGFLQTANVADLDRRLAQAIDLGRQLINQFLSLHRAIDNETPDRFENSLGMYIESKGRIIDAGQAENPFVNAPSGSEETRLGRVEWVENHLAVIKEMAKLDANAGAWVAAAPAWAAHHKDLFTIDPVMGRSEYGNFLAIVSEVERIRKWTVQAANFERGVAADPSWTDSLKQLFGSFAEFVAGIPPAISNAVQVALLVVGIVSVFVTLILILKD